MHACDPFFTPAEIVLRRLSVVIHIVFITDVERGIGKDQIDCAFIQLGQLRNAIALVDVVFFQ